MNLSSVLAYGVKLVDLDLLQVGQAAGGTGKAKIGKLGIAEVTVDKVAGQCPGPLPSNE